MSTTCISGSCRRPTREACVLISSASIGLVMGVIQITKSQLTPGCVLEIM